MASEKTLVRLMEAYHEHKVKNLGLFDVRLSLPTPEPWQMYTKAHELDEKEFEQWLFDFGK